MGHSKFLSTALCTHSTNSTATVQQVVIEVMMAETPSSLLDPTAIDHKIVMQEDAEEDDARVALFGLVATPVDLDGDDMGVECSPGRSNTMTGSLQDGSKVAVKKLIDTHDSNTEFSAEAYNQISACTEIALMSVQDEPEDRPTISEILEILRSNKRFQTRATEFMGPYSTGDMFNDDEKPIDPGSNKAKPLPGFTDDDGGRVSVKADHSKAAPLEATTISVQVEVTSSTSVAGRAPLDLVVALDVSNHMCDDGKLDRFKLTIEFFVEKLSPMDRVSIVTFSSIARACPLHAMSEVGKFYTMGIVDGLIASGDANIKAGLETAHEVLVGRQYMDRRAASIFLLSDGHEDHGDASQVSRSWNFPIYTFGLGADANMHLLHHLAGSSNGGTFNYLPDNGEMTVLHMVFEQMMEGLLEVVAAGLCLILSKPDGEIHDLDTIDKVESYSYSQETDRRSCTVTIMFGNLLGGQVRKVDADLLLFEADGSDYEADILDVSVAYQNSQRIRQPFKIQTLRITRSDADHTYP
ncbi:hypothetical protein PR202_gb26978 [Eleusine coracana subsp. coracana]|uniref:VWFA domain-containing protein n=1 Tax=Eleusine coracana subsp. coracana TaxID=191504 RepID=A0AAV5FT47_ELECO|nr:hypothetical protein PR202_gb26978 [Eleusine coracana subsp. coracana]